MKQMKYRICFIEFFSNFYALSYPEQSFLCKDYVFASFKKFVFYT
jgi:hypothetical protein